jgi:hypothetical protein
MFLETAMSDATLPEVGDRPVTAFYRGESWATLVDAASRP